MKEFGPSFIKLEDGRVVEIVSGTRTCNYLGNRRYPRYQCPFFRFPSRGKVHGCTLCLGHDRVRDSRGPKCLAAERRYLADRQSRQWIETVPDRGRQEGA